MSIYKTGLTARDVRTLGGGSAPTIDGVFSTYVYTGNGNQLSAAGTGRKSILQDLQISDRIIVDGFSNDTNLEAIFTTPGTHTWTCPAGVTSVCVVCVGGGAGNAGGGDGAGGGGLGWMNDIPVTPGDTYTVQVGAGGPSGYLGGTGLNNGGDSFFIDNTTVAGLGAPGYNSKAGGGFVGTGGGNGGVGTYGTGGGAGGYLGNGGFGRGNQNACNQHGRGGAGGAPDTWSSNANGGGVGIYGAGESGTTGDGSVNNGAPSEAYGFGAGNGNAGGDGAVRIIWGAGRSFPFNAGYQSRQIEGNDALVWLKSRDSSSRNHYLDYAINGEFAGGMQTNDDTAPSFASKFLNAKSDGGVEIMHSTTANQNQNQQNEDYVAWAMLKSARFLDIVTYTGDGVAGRAISHNLGSEVGMIIVRRTDSSGNWTVYHRGLDATAPETKYLWLNSNISSQDNEVWNDQAPTSSVFYLGGTNKNTNENGHEYVAYLFAHNDDGLGFGATQDIIKCGSYTGDGTTDGPEIDLGFEPQWLMIKKTDSATASGDWQLYDTMRGISDVSNGLAILEPNQSADENLIDGTVRLTPTGFKLIDSNFRVNASGSNYIYMAIRRPNKVPTSATEVFATDYGGNGSPAFISNFITDGMLVRNPTAASWNYLGARLQGSKTLRLNSTDAESEEDYSWDYMDGAGDTFGSSYLSWMWKRAAGYFDVVSFISGTSQDRRLYHNLGTAPEMVWVKRSDNASSWYVYHKDMDANPRNYRMFLHNDASKFNDDGIWGTSDPTATDFGLNENDIAAAPDARCMCYLFASLPGISSVGSFNNANTASISVDCGFTSGARFVMIKCTSATSDWYVWDTARGINSGTEPFLRLNTTDVQNTANDYIDQRGNGFALDGTALPNGDYIYYAIA